MGRPQLVIVVECDREDQDKVPRNLFETVRTMVEATGIDCTVSWYEDESD